MCVCEIPRCQKCPLPHLATPIRLALTKRRTLISRDYGGTAENSENHSFGSIAVRFRCASLPRAQRGIKWNVCGKANVSDDFRAQSRDGLARAVVDCWQTVHFFSGKENWEGEM